VGTQGAIEARSQPYNRGGVDCPESSRAIALSSRLGTEYGEFRLAQATWIDSSGREIHKPISVRSARSFSNGLAAVRAPKGAGLGGFDMQ